MVQDASFWPDERWSAEFEDLQRSAEAARLPPMAPQPKDEVKVNLLKSKNDGEDPAILWLGYWLGLG